MDSEGIVGVEADLEAECNLLDCSLRKVLCFLSDSYTSTLLLAH